MVQEDREYLEKSKQLLKQTLKIMKQIKQILCTLVLSALTLSMSSCSSDEETPIDAKGHTLADTLPAVEDGENSLAEKIETALQNMPDYLATICRDIMDGMSIKAILAKHHIPHSTFYRRDVPAIRRYLTESGIGPNDNCGGAR